MIDTPYHLTDEWKAAVATIGANVQKANRTPFETVVNYLISDPVLKNGLESIILLLNEHKIKPAWYHTSHYQCKYKGENIVSIKIGDGYKHIPNLIRINVRTTMRDNLDCFGLSLTNEMRNIMTNSFIKCNSCGHTERGPCDNIANFKFNGNTYNSICHMSIIVGFTIEATTPDLDKQFEMIKNFIRAKIMFNNANRDKIAQMKGPVRGL